MHIITFFKLQWLLKISKYPESSKPAAMLLKRLLEWYGGYTCVMSWIKKERNSKQLMTGFEDNSSFVWPEDGSVDRSRRLRAIDPLKCQIKLLLSKKPVFDCYVIHRHFIKIFLFMITLSTHISIRSPS